MISLKKMKEEKDLEEIIKTTERYDRSLTRSTLINIAFGIFMYTAGMQSSAFVPMALGLGVCAIDYFRILGREEYWSHFGEAKAIMQSHEYLELQGIYKNVLKEVRGLIQKMNVEQSTEICAVYEYLLKNGYLSVNGNFRYSNDALEARYLEGTSILSGLGRSIGVQSFFKDLLQESNVESYILLLKNSKLLDTLIHESLEEGNISINKFEQFCCDLAFCLGIRQDWPVTLIKEEKKSYMIDFYYNRLLTVGEDQKIYLVQDEQGEKRSFDLVSASYPSSYNDRKRKRVKPLLIPSSKETASMIEMYSKMMEKCPNYQDDFEKFYKQQKDLYEELVFKNREYCQKMKRK